MKANELRIGNYVNYCGQIITAGDCWDDIFHGISKHKKDKVTIEPIPLTEQWLKDFGLNPKNNYFKQLGVCYENGSYIAAFDDNEFGHNKEDEFLIKYVHQLQNLYFAIMGKELTESWKY